MDWIFIFSCHFFISRNSVSFSTLTNYNVFICINTLYFIFFFKRWNIYPCYVIILKYKIFMCLFFYFSLAACLLICYVYVCVCFVCLFLIVILYSLEFFLLLSTIFKVSYIETYEYVSVECPRVIPIQKSSKQS